VNAGPGAVGAAVLLAFAVLIWPRGRSSASSLGGLADLGAQRATRETSSGLQGWSGFWQQDPVELYRRWRLGRRAGDLVDDVLDLLRGIGPALDAGLTPGRAVEVSARAVLGAERVAAVRELVVRRHASLGRSGVGDLDALVGGLLDATDRAEAASAVWAVWADRSSSAELTLVAAAWRLSESTGAPLALAVERAVQGLLDARTRRRRVAVAVAGPRASAMVLTLLPLTGPLFGLACGIDPVTLYLGSPVAVGSVVLGLALVGVGRVWCARMIRVAVSP
jgi:tight adherence protein B